LHVCSLFLIRWFWANVGSGWDYHDKVIGVVPVETNPKNVVLFIEIEWEQHGSHLPGKMCFGNQVFKDLGIFVIRDDVFNFKAEDAFRIRHASHFDNFTASIYTKNGALFSSGNIFKYGYQFYCPFAVFFWAFSAVASPDVLSPTDNITVSAVSLIY
jgi:hypothetical protein